MLKLNYISNAITLKTDQLENAIIIILIGGLSNMVIAFRVSHSN